MWINREQYEANLKRTAKLEVELQSKVERISHLQDEVDYWREKFESAQNRADRIVDKSLTVSGIGPVSDLGVKEFEEVTGKYAKMMKEADRQATEMFADEIPSSGEDTGSFEIDPELLSSVVNGLKE